MVMNQDGMLKIGKFDACTVVAQKHARGTDAPVCYMELLVHVLDGADKLPNIRTNRIEPHNRLHRTLRTCTFASRTAITSHTLRHAAVREGSTGSCTKRRTRGRVLACKRANQPPQRALGKILCEDYELTPAQKRATQILRDCRMQMRCTLEMVITSSMRVERVGVCLLIRAQYLHEVCTVLQRETRLPKFSKN